jgi:hypothetical protein
LERFVNISVGARSVAADPLAGGVPDLLSRATASDTLARVLLVHVTNSVRVALSLPVRTELHKIHGKRFN